MTISQPRTSYVDEHDAARMTNDELLSALTHHRGGLSAIEREVLSRLYTVALNVAAALKEKAR